MGLLLFVYALAVAPVAADPSSFYRERERGFPYERDPFGRLMVGVHVNGVGPFPFIVDSGASRSIVYRSLTANLQLEALPHTSRNIITANGYKRVLIYPIEDIYALGTSLVLEDTVALPDIPNSSAQGLLGVDLLAGRILMVKPDTQIVRLLDQPEALPGEGWQYVQGRAVAYGSVALEIDIGGVEVPLIIDTGASDTIINRAGAETLMRSANGITSARVRAVVARGRTVARQKLLLPDLNLAGRSFGQTELYVADVPVFALLGASRVPAIILGMDLLDQQDFAVDFGNWRLYMRASSDQE